ncbi:MAG: phenylalanine--tRNA ligase subunit alpha [Acidobacteria bacterium]|nr:MAG: phenylalanine--tRNA ligase subunit alpha [Acidobacteriota bacterium]REK00817.1 MAG: phenylalanine--tRNA ligase subunit alpha [Acidobacteriota bacterium]
MSETSPETSLDFEAVQNRAEVALARCEDPEQLESWYYATLGRKGEVQLMSRQLGQLSAEERPIFGKRVNALKQALQVAYEQRREEIERQALERRLSAGAIDVTLPGRRPRTGTLHPSTLVLRAMCRIFGDMGFQIYRSPDVVTDEYNFEWLNMPPEHPARDMQDTFYTRDENVVLRTHTSAGQILAMREYHPEPIRVVLPGMCYRNEQITARSEIQFHQIEGLAVGEGITFADLKGTLTEFARRFFGAERQTRFRASYFPFTEPSAEMDVSCFQCDAKGCRLCKYSGWLEILGCGMVHPVVLRNGGYDPERFSGFAFGTGPERIAMLKYGLDDIRAFWGNDLRFLTQF